MSDKVYTEQDAIENLLFRTRMAKQKMEYEQKRDPNCVWHEFEMLIDAAADYLASQGYATHDPYTPVSKCNPS